MGWYRGVVLGCCCDTVIPWDVVIDGGFNFYIIPASFSSFNLGVSC